MIDNIKISKEVNFHKSIFVKNGFRHFCSAENEYYKKYSNRVHMRFYPRSNNLIIEGRIISFYSKGVDKIDNFDDVSLKENVKVSEVFKDVEKNLINEFFPNRNRTLLFCLDDFDVNYIEYCINLDVKKQEIVEAYIKMMNLIFIDKADSRYENFPIKHNKALYSSTYLKPKKAYEHNTKVGAIINFYNKFDQLSGKDKRGWDAKGKLEHSNSIENAIGILRMEVKLGSQALYRIRKNKGISKKFKEYQNINFAYNIVAEKYKYFFGCGDFYSYKENKNIINQSSMSPVEKNNLLKKYISYSKSIGQELQSLEKVNSSFTPHYRRMVNKLNINHVLIPKKIGVNKLESPLKLIERKREAVLRRA